MDTDRNSVADKVTGTDMETAIETCTVINTIELVHVYTYNARITRSWPRTDT